ncbi:hypothetical protein MRX96_008349 [Rhipicephalus microplus]
MERELSSLPGFPAAFPPHPLRLVDRLANDTRHGFSYTTAARSQASTAQRKRRRRRCPGRNARSPRLISRRSHRGGGGSEKAAMTVARADDANHSLTLARFFFRRCEPISRYTLSSSHRIDPYEVNALISLNRRVSGHEKRLPIHYAAMALKGREDILCCPSTSCHQIAFVDFRHGIYHTSVSATGTQEPLLRNKRTLPAASRHTYIIYSTISSFYLWFVQNISMS